MAIRTEYSRFSRDQVKEMGMRRLALGLGVALLSGVACGGGEQRTFSSEDAGADAGAGGGIGGDATGGASGLSGTGGTAGATGGNAGATGGTAGATGGTAGATGGAAGATGGAAGAPGGAAGASGGAGAAPCDTLTHVCTPDLEAGWTGPIAFHAGAGTPPSCPGSYAAKVADGKAGLKPGAASCKCSCEPATGISCTGTAKVYDVTEGVVGCTLLPGGVASLARVANNVQQSHGKHCRPSPTRHPSTEQQR